MKIILTGGGTAGHIMPHVALLDSYKKNFDQIVYVGQKEGMEKNIMEKQEGVKYRGITATKLVRKKIFTNLLIPFKLIKAIHESKVIIKEEQPNVIFSKGGFVSLPVCVAAKRYKVPVIAHESDLEMGLANKLSKPYVKVICTSFERTADKYKKAVWTGSPMRTDMITDKKLAREKLNITTNKPVLVITGGSLGAKFINDKIREEIKDILRDYFVIHLTGKNNVDERLNSLGDYRQIDFTLDMGTILSSADIVISRAGSNTIFELAVMRKPMLLIPLPKGNSRGDQVDNAKYFNAQGYARFVEQDQLATTSLKKYIDETYQDRNNLTNCLEKSGIAPGNDKIMEIILKEANAQKTQNQEK